MPTTAYYSAIYRSVNFFFVCVFRFSKKYQFLPSKSKYLSKNKLGINITLFTRLIIDLKLLLLSYQYIFLSVWSLCIDHLFYFLFSQQGTYTTIATRINMIPRHFFSRWLTSQDGHLWNCPRQGSIVITDIPYTTARLMDLLSEEAMTFTLPTTRHPVAIPRPTLAILTVHRAGTSMEAPSRRHFWQEEVIMVLHQTKWKHFTKQPKNCGIVFSFKLDSQLILLWLIH